MICNTCGHDLPEESYAWKNKQAGKRSGKCKQCHSAYVREHYAANKSSYIGRAKKSNKKYTDRNRELLNEYRSKLKCERCPEDHPAVLDFHHTDPTSKEESVARLMSSSRSFASIEKEISKCIVLCSNCHRKLHWNERNSGAVAQMEEATRSK